MLYNDKIKELTKTVPTALVDFGLPRDSARTPTQASSNFITNKEQGDWAEDLIFRAINETSKNFVAVKYGKSDDLVAGEDGFDIFYLEFQNELDTIGKRPDLLIFRKEDFKNSFGYDISQIPHHTIAEYQLSNSHFPNLKLFSMELMKNIYSHASAKFRDTIKVIGTVDILPSTFGIFYDDLDKPMSG